MASFSTLSIQWETMNESKTMNSEGTEYYLNVIWDKDLPPYIKTAIQNKATSIPKEKSCTTPVKNQSPPNEPRPKKEAFKSERTQMDQHPFPLPEIPKIAKEDIEEEAGKSGHSTYDVLWDYPAPEWPEPETQFRFKINLNPLDLRRKTICCLFVMGFIAALLAGMTAFIIILIGRIKTGKVLFLVRNLR